MLLGLVYWVAIAFAEEPVSSGASEPIEPAVPDTTAPTETPSEATEPTQAPVSGESTPLVNTPESTTAVPAPTSLSDSPKVQALQPVVQPPPTTPREEISDLWALLDDMPPRGSWELAVSVGFGQISYWWEHVPPWVGFGLRGGWGTHFGERRNHRVGAGLSAIVEGPIPEYFTTSIEPAATWDYVHNKGFAVGASLGPAILIHSHSTTLGPEVHPGISPSIAARVGWSQPYSRVKRRLFIVAEPKFRWIADRPTASISVVVGSGFGY